MAISVAGHLIELPQRYPNRTQISGKTLDLRFQK